MSAVHSESFEDDNSTIQYSGNWGTSPWQTFNGNQQGNLHFANGLEAFFTFLFPVPALGIEYWGVARSDGALYDICLDCDPQLKQGDPAWNSTEAVNEVDDANMPPGIIWARNFSKPEIHTLVVHNRNDTRFGSSQITLDRLVLYIPNPPASSSDQQNPSATPSANNSTNPPPPGVNDGTKSSPPVGAIVGGVVGGVIGILALGILFWRFFRRPSRTFDDDVFHRHDPIPYTVISQRSTSPPTIKGELGHSRSTSNMERASQHTPETIDETDAGPVPTDTQEEPVRNPPPYHKVFSSE